MPGNAGSLPKPFQAVDPLLTFRCQVAQFRDRDACQTAGTILEGERHGMLIARGIEVTSAEDEYLITCKRAKVAMLLKEEISRHQVPQTMGFLLREIIRGWLATEDSEAEGFFRAAFIHVTDVGDLPKIIREELSKKLHRAFPNSVGKVWRAFAELTSNQLARTKVHHVLGEFLGQSNFNVLRLAGSVVEASGLNEEVDTGLANKFLELALPLLVDNAERSMNTLAQADKIKKDLHLDFDRIELMTPDDLVFCWVDRHTMLDEVRKAIRAWMKENGSLCFSLKLAVVEALNCRAHLCTLKV